MGNLEEMSLEKKKEFKKGNCQKCQNEQTVYNLWQNQVSSVFVL